MNDTAVAAPNYSKQGLLHFLNVIEEQGLMKPNSVAGWRACMRMLEDVGGDVDVRTVDVPTAIKRYHNKHPGELRPTVLLEYERRLTRAISDFIQYTDNPQSYKGRGRAPTDGASTKRPTMNLRKVTKVDPATDAQIQRAIDSSSANLAAVKEKLVAALTSSPPKIAMTVDFNMRPDFLAQAVVPRDMTTLEAKRFCRFIMALAIDDEPKEGEG